MSAIVDVLYPQWGSAPPEVKRWRAAGVLLLAAGVLGATALWLNKTLSTNAEMKRIVIDQFQESMPVGSLPESQGTYDERAASLSNRIRDAKRRRDLIIAVTVLGKGGAADRYLALPASKKELSELGREASLLRSSERFVFGNEERLVKLIIASGSIFPIFQSELFPDTDGLYKDIKIIDGGFAHNIPVEAAVEAGATHIIVIEATPSVDRREHDSFVKNLWTAYQLLFAQAQLTICALVSE